MTSFSCNSTTRGLFSISGDTKAPIYSARSEEKKNFHTSCGYNAYTSEFINDTACFVTNLNAPCVCRIGNSINNLAARPKMYKTVTQITMLSTLMHRYRCRCLWNIWRIKRILGYTNTCRDYRLFSMIKVFIKSILTHFFLVCTWFSLNVFY